MFKFSLFSQVIMTYLMLGEVSRPEAGPDWATRVHGLNQCWLTHSSLTSQLWPLGSPIKSITKAALYQSQNISRVKGLMSHTDKEKLIQAFISSRLDNSNDLLTWTPLKSIKQLQLTRNAEAPLLTRTKRSEIINSSSKVFTLAPSQLWRRF